MNKRFIRIDNRIFAVEHIVALNQFNNHVYMRTVEDSEPWEFEGQDAEALWAWASSLLNTVDCVEFYAAHNDTGQGGEHV